MSLRIQRKSRRMLEKLRVLLHPGNHLGLEWQLGPEGLREMPEHRCLHLSPHLHLHLERRRRQMILQIGLSHQLILSPRMKVSLFLAAGYCLYFQDS